MNVITIHCWTLLKISQNNHSQCKLLEIINSDSYSHLNMAFLLYTNYYPLSFQLGTLYFKFLRCLKIY